MWILSKTPSPSLKGLLTQRTTRKKCKQIKISYLRENTWSRTLQNNSFKLIIAILLRNPPNQNYNVTVFKHACLSFNLHLQAAHLSREIRTVLTTWPSETIQKDTGIFYKATCEGIRELLQLTSFFGNFFQLPSYSIPFFLLG